MNKISIAEFWDIVLHFEYERNILVDSISKWLTEFTDPMILDAACGTGFPALDLIKLGFKLTCSDGSSTMLAHFSKNAMQAGLDVSPYNIKWDQLSEFFEEKFNVIFCR